MNIEELQMLANNMQGVSEDIKWDEHLCFSIAGKMFLIINLHEVPVSASFKIDEEAFEAYCQKPGFIPAPYLARYHWVQVDDINKLSKTEWEQNVENSYQLVAANLPLNVRRLHGI